MNIFFVLVFQTENDTLKQIVIRDGHEKPSSHELQFNLTTLQNLYNKSYRVDIVLYLFCLESTFCLFLV